jgi:hypothetical protein
MASVKEIYVEIKRSKNYQTYTAGELIQVESTDELEAERNKAYARCRQSVSAQMVIDKN